jgi:hypothetical protein
MFFEAASQDRLMFVKKLTNIANNLFLLVKCLQRLNQLFAFINHIIVVKFLNLIKTLEFTVNISDQVEQRNMKGL